MVFRASTIALAASLLCIGLITAGFTWNPRPASEPISPCEELVVSMLDNIASVRTMEFQMRSTERMDGKYVTKSSVGKVQYEPYRVYVKMLPPETEREVLFIKGQNNDKVLVNPAAFPYFNVNLDPYGSLMRGGNHHVIYDVGFGFFEGVISYAYESSKHDFSKYFSQGRDTIVGGHPCFQVVINNRDFHYDNYTVQKGETVVSIAQKFHVSDYLIVEKNKDVDDYEDVDAGDVIKVPSDYARKVVLCIDKAMRVPRFIQVFDESSLLEQYEYVKMKLNPVLPPETFSEKNPAYGF